MEQVMTGYMEGEEADEFLEEQRRAAEELQKNLSAQERALTSVEDIGVSDISDEYVDELLGQVALGPVEKVGPVGDFWPKKLGLTVVVGKVVG
jgi:hypothetical protein